MVKNTSTKYKVRFGKTTGTMKKQTKQKKIKAVRGFDYAWAVIWKQDFLDPYVSLHLFKEDADEYVGRTALSRKSFKVIPIRITPIIKKK